MPRTGLAALFQLNTPSSALDRGLAGQREGTDCRWAGRAAEGAAAEGAAAEGAAAEGAAAESIAHLLSLDKARSCAIAVARATVMRGSRALSHGSDRAVDDAGGHPGMITRKSACSIRPYQGRNCKRSDQ